MAELAKCQQASPAAGFRAGYLSAPATAQRFGTSLDWLGRSQYAADPFLDGQVDDFRIYSQALSAAEVMALFAQP